MKKTLEHQQPEPRDRPADPAWRWTGSDSWQRRHGNGFTQSIEYACKSKSRRYRASVQAPSGLSMAGRWVAELPAAEAWAAALVGRVAEVERLMESGADRVMIIGLNELRELQIDGPDQVESILRRLDRLTEIAQWLADNRDAEIAFAALELLDFVTSQDREEPELVSQYKLAVAQEAGFQVGLMGQPGSGQLSPERLN